MRSHSDRLTAAMVIAIAVVALSGSPALARTACKKDATAACVELAGHIGRYDQLVWAVCTADSDTVCKCWDAQQRDSGVDWCQWASCACTALTDATLKQGICGLSTACGSIAAIKQQQQKMVDQSAPARLAAQVEQVRNGEIVACSPAACMAAGAECARAAGALQMLKDGGRIADAASCAQLAKDPTAFAKQVHIDGVPPAIAACACAAVF
jgi:hypothetical protein